MDRFDKSVLQFFVSASSCFKNRKVLFGKNKPEILLCNNNSVSSFFTKCRQNRLEKQKNQRREKLFL